MIKLDGEAEEGFPKQPLARITSGCSHDSDDDNDYSDESNDEDGSGHDDEEEEKGGSTLFTILMIKLIIISTPELIVWRQKNTINQELSLTIMAIGCIDVDRVKI